MLRRSRAFSGKIHRPFFAYVVPPLSAGITRRRLVAKVGTFENKKVHKHLHLWPLGPLRRRLAVRSGTSKGSKISQYGCSTFGALATEAQQKKEERRTPREPFAFTSLTHDICTRSIIHPPSPYHYMLIPHELSLKIRRLNVLFALNFSSTAY